MSDAPTAGPPDQPGPSQDQAAGGAAPTRSGRLIGLVRKLIDHGKQLVAILQQPCTPARFFDMTRNFGTINIPLIMARITRGLAIAAALESRLIRTAFRLDNPLPRAFAAVSPRPAQPKPPRTPVRAAKPADADAALLARMPTAREIAARVRRQPIGVVLADICNDLGIVTSDPFWQELHEAVVLNGGSIVRMVGELFKRTSMLNFISPDTVMVPPVPDRPFAEVPWPFFAVSTGPP